MVLYEDSEKRLADRMRFEAQIHGIDVKEDSSRPQKKSAARTDGKCIPGDPDSYSHLSMEERDELTRKMMGKHKVWAQETKPLGGKKMRAKQ